MCSVTTWGGEMVACCAHLLRLQDALGRGARDSVVVLLVT